ncbi:MAG: hypothetical protein ACREH8_23485 [Opitutaceae bacterium]
MASLLPETGDARRREKEPRRASFPVGRRLRGEPGQETGGCEARASREMGFQEITSLHIIFFGIPRPTE